MGQVLNNEYTIVTAIGQNLTEWYGLSKAGLKVSPQQKSRLRWKAWAVVFANHGFKYIY